MKKIIMTLIFAALVSTTASAATGKAPSAMDEIKQQATAASQDIKGLDSKAANSSASKAAGSMGKSALNRVKGFGSAGHRKK